MCNAIDQCPWCAQFQSGYSYQNVLIHRRKNSNQRVARTLRIKNRSAIIFLYFFFFFYTFTTDKILQKYVCVSSALLRRYFIFNCDDLRIEHISINRRVCFFCSGKKIYLDTDKKHVSVSNLIAHRSTLGRKHVVEKKKRTQLWHTVSRHLTSNFNLYKNPLKIKKRILSRTGVVNVV